MQETSGNREAHEEARRRVMWGERAEDIRRALQVEHGVSGEVAEQIHRQAVVERVAEAKAAWCRRMVWGLGLVLCSLLVLLLTWEVTQGFEVWEIPRFRLPGRQPTYVMLPIISGLLFLTGCILGIDGCARWLTAENRGGELDDEE